MAAEQVRLTVGQIIILILGVALFVYGLIGWVNPSAGITLPFLCPIGILLLGLLLLLGGGYFYPLFQASGSGEVATAAVAIIAILGVVVAGMFVPGIITPCDYVPPDNDLPDNDNDTNSTTTTNVTTTAPVLEYYLGASPDMDALWAGVARVEVYSDEGEVNELESFQVDDQSYEQGTHKFSAGVVVWLKITSDSGLYVVPFSLIVGDPSDTWIEFDLLSEVDDLWRGTIDLKWVPV